MSALLARLAFAVLRHLLTLAGGAMAAHGWITASEAERGLGAIMTLAALAWSAADKLRHPVTVAPPAHDTDGLW